jgi:chromosome segregation ATPase
MKVHPLFAVVVLLSGTATSGEPKADMAALQAERRQVEAERKQLHSQLRAQRERLEELQRRIDGLRRQSSALDTQIQQVIVDRGEPQGGSAEAPKPHPNTGH